MKKPIENETGAQSPNDPKLSDCRSTAQPVPERRPGWLRRWAAQAVTCVGSSLQRMVRRRSDSELSDSDLIDWLASNDCRLQSLEADIPYPVDPVKRVFVIRFECGTIEAVDLRWALRKAMKDAKQTPQ